MFVSVRFFFLFLLLFFCSFSPLFFLIFPWSTCGYPILSCYLSPSRTRGLRVLSFPSSLSFLFSFLILSYPLYPTSSIYLQLLDSLSIPPSRNRLNWPRGYASFANHPPGAAFCFWLGALFSVFVTSSLLLYYTVFYIILICACYYIRPVPCFAYFHCSPSVCPSPFTPKNTQNNEKNDLTRFQPASCVSCVIDWLPGSVRSVPLRPVFPTIITTITFHFL